jgi:L-rhamnose mutarotase
MQRIAFKMQLHKGKEVEYKRRHDAIWPELEELLKKTGISEYSIFLDKRTGELTGILKVSNRTLMDALPMHPVMQKWWTFMSDIMETNADGSPLSFPLEEVFYLP